jgi:hypothetical protein
MIRAMALVYTDRLAEAGSALAELQVVSPDNRDVQAAVEGKLWGPYWLLHADRFRARAAFDRPWWSYAAASTTFHPGSASGRCSIHCTTTTARVPARKCARHRPWSIPACVSVWDSPTRRHAAARDTRDRPRTPPPP